MSKKSETAVAPVIQMPTSVGFAATEQHRGSYIAFPKSTARRFPLIRGQYPQFREYEPILTHQTGGEERFDLICGPAMDFSCVWVGGVHYYGAISPDTGSILQAVPGDSPASEIGPDLQETVEGVVLVWNLKGEVHPARVSLRLAMANVGHRLNRALTSDYASPDWAKAHPDTLKYPVPYRGYGHVTVSVHNSRRRPGNKYPQGVARVVPMDAERYSQIVTALASPEFESRLTGTMRSFSERVAEVQSKF